MNVDTYMHLTGCLLLCRCLGSLLRSRVTPALDSASALNPFSSLRCASRLLEIEPERALNGDFAVAEMSGPGHSTMVRIGLALLAGTGVLRSCHVQSFL